MDHSLLALAIAPSLAIIIFLYQKDKYEKEPITLIAMCFFLGVLSTIPAIVLGKSASYIYPNTGSIGTNFIHAFIIVAFVEEAAKFIFLRYYAFPKKDFNEPYDGILYSVMISLGFATLENILYVMSGGYEVALSRMFTAVPAHASFAVIMGYYAGKAKFQHDKRKRAVLFLKGLLAATLFHGAYDFFLFIDNIPNIFIGAFVSLVTVVYLSSKAIKAHIARSPFKS